MKRYAIILLLFPGVIFAQDALPTVQVELLFFKHRDIARENVENLLEMPSRPSNVIPAGYALFDTRSTKISNGDITLLNDYHLEEQYTKLFASEKFEVIHRVAWQQPRYQEDQTFFIAIIPENQGGLLKGSARLSYDRLYQLKINLLYDADASLLLTEAMQPEEHQFKQSRTLFIDMVKVMTHGKVYYLDHALIGVLAIIHETEN